MLLTLRTTHRPAIDLGYLLGKNPARVQSFDLSFGRAHVFYPEADEVACTAALLLDVDPVGLVRGKAGPSEGGALDRYVNDRPYVASSFLSVALAQTLGSALAGRSRDRPELAETPIPLETRSRVAAEPQAARASRAAAQGGASRNRSMGLRAGGGRAGGAGRGTGIASMECTTAADLDAAPPPGPQAPRLVSFAQSLICHAPAPCPCSTPFRPARRRPTRACSPP